MPQSTTSNASNHSNRRLPIPIDMGRDSWDLCMSDSGKRRREIKIDRQDLAKGKVALVAEVDHSKAHFGLPADAPIHTL